MFRNLILFPYTLSTLPEADMKLLLGFLTGCQPSLNGYRGSLYSPSFPYYGNYERCYWRITVPGGYRIGLHFNTFDTESGRDYLNIYDGPSSWSPLLASLTGYRRGYVYYSSGPSLWFHWYTDSSGTRQGFAASYWAIYGEYWTAAWATTIKYLRQCCNAGTEFALTLP